MTPAVRDTGSAPGLHEPRFFWLLLGCATAPLFWLGQIFLSYGVTSYVCYPADHPVTLASPAAIFSLLALADGIALAACAVGALVSWRAWRHPRGENGRSRFLALWGLLSSLGFFAAILFNVLASLAVPACAA